MPRYIFRSPTKELPDLFDRYKNVIAADPKYCMGSFVFLWGQKQERTPTWYGMFLENGNKTASVDVMHYVWNGEWPENRTPQLDSLRRNGRNAYSSIRIKKGEISNASVYVFDHENDQLEISWEIIPEVPEEQQSDGGDKEKRQATAIVLREIHPGAANSLHVFTLYFIKKPQAMALN